MGAIGPAGSAAANLGRRRFAAWSGVPLLGLLGACAAVDTPEACRVEHVADVPLRMVNGLPVVVVQVGGKPLRMVLDTGSDSMVITPGAADRLGLDRDFSRFGTSTGLGSQASFWPTTPVAVQLGSVTAPPLPFVVGAVPALRGGTAPEGLLGGAVLAAYDVDVDIAQRRLSLYRARRCPNGPAPFPGASFSVPASRIGASRMGVTARLDGRDVSFLVDTGANRTLVDPATAGLADDAVQTDRAGFVHTADPTGLDARLHTFRTLQLGSDAVDNPLLMVARVDKPGFNGVLGTDYWRNHRVWLSYGSQTVFVGTPAPR